MTNYTIYIKVLIEAIKCKTPKHSTIKKAHNELMTNLKILLK